MLWLHFRGALTSSVFIYSLCFRLVSKDSHLWSDRSEQVWRVNSFYFLPLLCSNMQRVALFSVSRDNMVTFWPLLLALHVTRPSLMPYMRPQSDSNFKVWWIQPLRDSLQRKWIFQPWKSSCWRDREIVFIWAGEWCLLLYVSSHCPALKR